MQPMLAFHILDLGATTLIVVGLVALCVGVAVVGEKISVRRAIREFSQFPCPKCGNPLGESAASAGKDVSPFEEIWGDDDGTKSRHCHPMCREVRCAACDHEFVLRLNRRGTKCGPRLSVRSYEDDGGAAAA
jgi:hypothetical protein